MQKLKLNKVILKNSDKEIGNRYKDLVKKKIAKLTCTW